MGETFINWNALRNPVYGHGDWAVKDACMAYRAGWVYLFTSAFYHDRGELRSHVIGVRTRDFLTFSEPLFIWDGVEDGWLGMCSPDIVFHDGIYYLTYNTWGDKPGRVNQLYYATSQDLEHWQSHQPLAAAVTEGVRAIDASVAFANGKCYLTWKRRQRPAMAVADRIAVEAWTFLGEIAGGWCENAQLVSLDGQWRMTAQVQYAPSRAAIRTMQGDGTEDSHWLQWGEGTPLAIPQEPFGAHQALIGPAIVDWRAHDGFFYCIYAGNTEAESNAGRGDCRLALARSRDLQTWTVAGVPEDAVVAP